MRQVLASAVGLCVAATLASAPAQAAPSADDCQQQLVPQCVRNLYGVQTNAGTDSRVLVVAPFGASRKTLLADLAQFATTVGSPGGSSPSPTLTWLGDSSAFDPQNPTHSGWALNTTAVAEWVFAVAPNASIEILFTADDSIGSLGDALSVVAGRPQSPEVLLLTYGANEPDVPKNQAVAVCQTVAQFGSRGVSVLAATGDEGVGPATQTRFVTTFPATCPNTTAVGATTGNPEVAATFSGGGFSDVFDRPQYQSTAVTSYLNSLGNQHAGMFPPAGRAGPDVAAQGESMVIVNDGKQQLLTGTGIAAAIWAGVIADLDAELRAAGKAPLGFLNPILYSSADRVLTDITSGSNPGAGTTGFPARPGWDPVAGLGTPDYSKLRTALGL